MSAFLLDTNIPSELIRTLPEPRVTAWFYAQEERFLFLSVISIGELRRGTALLTLGKHRTKLEEWLQVKLLPGFHGRILSVTQGIAERWGELDAQAKLRGTPLATADGLIAATALEHDLTLVTRNVKDFSGLGLSIVNPWNLQP